MRRSLAVLTALALAVFGTVVLVAYVRGADARAESGAILVPVLVVAEEVPAGTSVADLADSLTTEQVPQRLVATGALDDLADVDGLSTTVVLLPGEQVVAGRFSDPAVTAAAGEVAVPAGTQEVSLSLESQRAVDGRLEAGDEVGVYISTSAADVTATTVTALAVDHALVTGVSSSGTELAAVGSTVTVTLALTPADAVTVIGGMAQNNVWLSLQSSVVSADTSVSSTTTSTGDDQ